MVGMLRMLLAGVAPALLVIAGIAGSTRAQTFEFAIWFNERDPYAAFAKEWSADIEKRTSGRVKIKLHFSGALVAAKETVNAVRQGAAGGGTTRSSFLTGIVRELSYVEPLFWITEEPEVAVKIVSEITPLARDLMRKHKLELLFMLPSAGVLSMCINKHMKQVSDWKGAKVRAAGRWQGIQLRAVGSAPVAIDPGEIYIALQNKTVDCALFLATYSLSGKLYEVAPYVTYFRQGANASFYFVNADLWAKVSPADQAQVREASTAIVAKAAPSIAAEHNKALDEMVKLGAKAYKFTDDDIKALKKAMSPVWSEIDRLVGPSGKAIRDKVSAHW
jgi:TRAP-type C4-dicarboxylate transport system substrate-binding protein